MLGFFKDAQLTIPVTSLSPKKFLVPESGRTKDTSLWIGDAYTAKVITQANAGATTLELEQTQEFPSSGAVIVGAQQLTYTGRTINSLTGIPAAGPGSIASTINVGSLAYPNVEYQAAEDFRVFVGGPGLSGSQPQVLVALKRPDQSLYNLPGVAALYTTDIIASGVSNAIRVDLRVTVLPGDEAEFSSWGLYTTPFDLAARSISVISPTAPGWVLRKDQGLPQRVRLLPGNRELKSAPAAFRFGEYRWRDAETANGVELVPTSWDSDVHKVGTEKFIAGIGSGTDLELTGLQQDGSSIRPKIHRGHYFTGYRRYYLPGANQKVEFLPSASAAGLNFVLQETPRIQTPVFVGTWKMDEQGFYEKDVEYHYAGHLFDTGYVGKQFTLRKSTRELALNEGMESFTLLVGVLAGDAVEYFDLPVHPVDRIVALYVDNPRIYTGDFQFDREQGTLSFPEIGGSAAGQPVYAVCEPAVAVVYETTVGGLDHVTSDVDLNPAFSGVGRGFLYLQHRRPRAASIELTVDKPRIPIPATHTSIIGLVAYGPVRYEGDYALLTASVFSRVPGETVPNIVLKVVPGTDFKGLVNYKDPLLEDVFVTTGGDGRANLVYTPRSDFGSWLDLTASVEGTDTLVLPDPVPISQIRNDDEGWLVLTYVVRNDNFLLGLLGGNISQGEVPFQESGTPGTSSYRTNGMRELWAVAGSAKVPIEALDAADRNYDDPLFDGNVVKLVYDDDLPTGSNIGAYFVSYVERVTLKVQAVNSNVLSNSILLQMEVPGQIFENPFLILDDDVAGRLNQFRLGVTEPYSTIPDSDRV